MNVDGRLRFGDRPRRSVHDLVVSVIGAGFPEEQLLTPHVVVAGITADVVMECEANRSPVEGQPRFMFAAAAGEKNRTSSKHREL